MSYLLISILILTFVLYFVRKASDLSICPICMATVLTWGFSFLALAFNFLNISPVLIALLMAISLGAFIEKYGSRFGLVWKTVLIVIGFPAVYLVTQGAFLKAVLSALALLLFTTMFFILKKEKKINDKFEGCC